jgi:hypothetical protein
MLNKQMVEWPNNDNSQWDHSPFWQRFIETRNSRVFLKEIDDDPWGFNHQRFQEFTVDQWEISRILKWRYCTILLAIFCGDIPWNLGLKNKPNIYGIGIPPSSIGSRRNGHWNFSCGCLRPYPLVNKQLDPENGLVWMETNLPTPMSARVELLIYQRVISPSSWFGVWIFRGSISPGADRLANSIEQLNGRWCFYCVRSTRSSKQLNSTVIVSHVGCKNLNGMVKLAGSKKGFDDGLHFLLGISEGINPWCVDSQWFFMTIAIQNLGQRPWHMGPSSNPTRGTRLVEKRSSFQELPCRSSTKLLLV